MHIERSEVHPAVALIHTIFDLDQPAGVGDHETTEIEEPGDVEIHRTQIEPANRAAFVALRGDVHRPADPAAAEAPVSK